MNKFYLLNYDYSGGEPGCPSYFKADLNHPWSWDRFDPSSFKDLKISEEFVYKAKHAKVDFDFWAEGDLVSENFLEICDFFHLAYLKVPVKIIQSDGKETQKKYYFLLCKDWLNILDFEKSELNFSTDIRTGVLIYDKYLKDVPVVEAIYKAVIDESKTNGKNIFRSTDFESGFICSEAFKAECHNKKIKGINFELINEEFKKIPFWLNDQSKI